MFHPYVHTRDPRLGGFDPYSQKPTSPSLDMSTEVSEATAVATRSELPEMHTAARAGDVERLKQLVTRENVNDPAEDGSFALQWAASGNHWQATKFLLEKGADPNLRGPMDATALHWVTRNGLVYMAQLLINRGADTSAVDSQAYTILHVAVHSSNVLMVIYLLHLDQPADPNIRDASGRTPLHWAAYQGDHFTVKSLLRAGADPNIQDSEGFTPLHWSLVSREPTCIETLVGAKSNLSLRTNEDKSCWVIAEEMSSTYEWANALKANDRRPESGMPVHRRIKPLFAKGFLFILPLFLLPAFIKILIWSKFGLPTALVAFYIVHRICLRYFYPVIDPSSHAILKSPVLAGIYNGMFLWVIVVFFYFVFPSAWKEHPALTLLLILLLFLIVTFYAATVFLDPGSILPGKINDRRKNITSLMDQGLYDGQHFCAHSWAVKPARAHYSKISKTVIARFDHYCPWTYNCVGLRNHRTFMLYVLCLGLGVWIYGYLYFGYLATLSDTFMGAVQKTKFSALFTLGTFIQGSWITLLAVTQLVQVARGLTTAEFGHESRAHSFSSLPHDHPLSTSLPNPPTDDNDATQEATPAPKHGGCFTTCLKVLGVHQAMVTSKSVKRKRSSGYGILTNCGDFWCTGWDLLQPNGEGRLGGKHVNYYTLMDTPKPGNATLNSSDAGNMLRRIV